MNERPEQPPEGKIITAALERSGLSIRKAAERAGISYGRWRQVTTGVQHVSPGEYAAVRAPAATLARMAAAAGVTPEQLETEGGRPDAAELLRGLLQRAPGAPAARTFGWTPADAGVVSSEEQAEMMPQATTILTAVIRAQDKGADPSLLTGTDLFPDQPHLALAWDTARQRDPWEVAIWTAAKGLLAWEKDVAARRQGRHGSAGA